MNQIKTILQCLILILLTFGINAFADQANLTKSIKQKFPIGTLINSSHFNVAPSISLYYEERGNKNGPAIVYLHGGPGGWSKPEDSQWFDPAIYHIILFDQRGTGNSIPSLTSKTVSSRLFATLRTKGMVMDMEKLRQHLHLKKWTVFGGSWGSTLALAYSEMFPNHVDKLILYGIFLNTQPEMDDYYTTARIEKRFPLYGKQAIDQLYQYASDKGYTINPNSAEQFVTAYYQLCVLKDDAFAQYLWSEFELFNDEPTQSSLNKLKISPATLSLSARDRTHAVFETAIFRDAFQNNGILDRNNLNKLKSIPIEIIQGKEDTEAPPIYAQELYSDLKNIHANVNYILIQNGKHDGNSSDDMTIALLNSV